MLRRLYALSGRVFFRRAGVDPYVARANAGEDVIFRMRAWPQLPEDGRTAEVYRMLSIMSHRPVNRKWLLSRCHMAPQQLDALLMHLVAQGSIEVIDPARFARG